MTSQPSQPIIFASFITANNYTLIDFNVGHQVKLGKYAGKYFNPYALVKDNVTNEQFYICHANGDNDTECVFKFEAGSLNKVLRFDVPLKLNSKPTPSGREFNVTSVPLHWAYNPVHTVHKPETMLTFPVLTMDTYESVLTGANPQNIRMPFNHPVLSMSIQVVDIPIKSAVFIPFPFDDKRNYKIPLEFNTETRCWEIIFQNPVAPLAELFSDKTTINFSKLTNPDPVLVITPETISVDDTNHSWKVNIWVCQRNICRVMSGMAGLAFMG